MPPRCWGSSGYQGVHVRPSGVFYVEIRSDKMRLGLGTFDTVGEAACEYNAATWRLPRPHREMNFHEVMTREWAQRLASSSRLVTEEGCRKNRRQKRRLGIAEMDEQPTVTWRQQFPRDVLDERELFVQRRAERRAKRDAYREDRRMWKQVALFNIELKETSTRDPNDER
ncbi:Ethylene-responsive transcription factor CRF1 [Hordeum vulgare]|nr:Ethylene-responsive transcription factor CRF1 [Hordeum vulgare]